MPQSASAVGLARNWCPQNNSTTNCCFYNTVVLGQQGNFGSLPETASDCEESGRPPKEG
jgi:hypothetical protein